MQLKARKKYSKKNFFKNNKKLYFYNRVKTFNYFPFSLGARNCIGKNFAQVSYYINKF